MLAFGIGMVLIMIWRPRGLVAHRDPTISASQAAEAMSATMVERAAQQPLSRRADPARSSI